MKTQRPNSKPPVAEEALTEALRFLARRARSEAEIAEHLQRKGYASHATSHTLDSLRRSGYAGDASFAREWARSRADSRAYGPRRIEGELRAKGVEDTIIFDALRDTFGADAANNERERAVRALAKRFSAKQLEEPKTRRRAAMFLERRGYSDAVIQRLLTLEED